MPPTKNSQASTSQEELKLRVMRVIEENPTATQREIAQELNVSLGGVNYCLKALVDRGLVKLSNFAKSAQEGLRLYLHARGRFGKSKITVRFLKRKMAVYELLQQEIEQLRSEVGEKIIQR